MKVVKTSKGIILPPVLDEKINPEEHVYIFLDEDEGVKLFSDPKFRENGIFLLRNGQEKTLVISTHDDCINPVDF
jgi:hypothetical protein